MGTSSWTKGGKEATEHKNGDWREEERGGKKGRKEKVGHHSEPDPKDRETSEKTGTFSSIGSSILFAESDAERHKVVKKPRVIESRVELEKMASENPLWTLQPEFKHDGFYFKDCLLLHRLLIEGKGEEVLRRRQELSPSILKHTCTFGDFPEVRHRESG